MCRLCFPLHSRTDRPAHHPARRHVRPANAVWSAGTRVGAIEPVTTVTRCRTKVLPQPVWATSAGGGDGNVLNTVPLWRTWASIGGRRARQVVVTASPSHVEGLLHCHRLQRTRPRLASHTLAQLRLRHPGTPMHTVAGELLCALCVCQALVGAKIEESRDQRALTRNPTPTDTPTYVSNTARMLFRSNLFCLHSKLKFSRLKMNVTNRLTATILRIQGEVHVSTGTIRSSLLRDKGYPADRRCTVRPCHDTGHRTGVVVGSPTRGTEVSGLHPSRPASRSRFTMPGCVHSRGCRPV